MTYQVKYSDVIRSSEENGKRDDIIWDKSESSDDDTSNSGYYSESEGRWQKHSG